MRDKRSGKGEYTMKRRTMRLVLFAISLMLLFGCFGCTQKDDASLSELVNELMQERKKLEEKLDTVEVRLNETEKKLSLAEAEANAAKTELERLKSSSAEPTVVTETKEIVKEVPVSGEFAIGVGCTVNGGMTALLNGSTQVQCVVKNRDGYAFDHWEVDGTAQNTTEKTLTVNVSKTTVIEAVFHERHILKCINCYFQFLTNQGNASGKKYKEFDFEEGYTNPATRKKESGGLISFYITADIPKRQEVDYWLINGVKYQFPNNVTKFRVENLDEATVYEVVFKNQTKRNTQTPSPLYPNPTVGR